MKYLLRPRKRSGRVFTSTTKENTMNAQQIPFYTGSAATAAFRGLVWARIARETDDAKDREECQRAALRSFSCARILHDDPAVERIVRIATR